MLDFLQRDQAPLGDEEWRAQDDLVVRTAQSTLVGRRILTVVGPFGPGAQALQNDAAGAERSLHEAIELARRQQARLFELRSADALRRLANA